MTSYIAHTTVNALDAYAKSEWWKQVLDWTDVPGDPNEAGHEECMIQSPDGGQRVLFIEVPDAKVGRNRLHFDLRPSQGSRDEEVERLVGIGATVVDDQRDHYGPSVGWMVLADPEGNEFCVLRSEAERGASA